MSIILEKATLHHIAVLEELARSTFTATFGPFCTPDNLKHHLDKTCSAEFFRQELSSGCNIDIAKMTHDWVGYIKYGDVGLPIGHDSRDAEIHRLYITTSHQRMGIGRQLMTHALHSPRLQSAPNLFLGVWENNHKAQGFYSHHGFYPVGEYFCYVGTHKDREIIMRRSA